MEGTQNQHLVITYFGSWFQVGTQFNQRLCFGLAKQANHNKQNKQFLILAFESWTFDGVAPSGLQVRRKYLNKICSDRLHVQCFPYATTNAHTMRNSSVSLRRRRYHSSAGNRTARQGSRCKYIILTLSCIFQSIGSLRLLHRCIKEESIAHCLYTSRSPGQLG